MLHRSRTFPDVVSYYEERDTMDVTIGKGNSPTLTYVTVGTLELAFSYETIVAFRAWPAPWVKSENVWSKTTGKHLNEVPGERIAHADFETKLAALLASIKTVTTSAQTLSLAEVRNGTGFPTNARFVLVTD